MDVMKKFILSKYPDYDFERYRFQPGDIVKANDGSVLAVDLSAINYVTAFPIRRSFKYHIREFQRVPYTDLPYYRSGGFVSEDVEINTSLKWKIGDVVVDEYGNTVLLVKDEGYQYFIGYVLDTDPDMKYCLHTRVCVCNPWREYVVC